MEKWSHGTKIVVPRLHRNWNQQCLLWHTELNYVCYRHHRFQLRAITMKSRYHYWYHNIASWNHCNHKMEVHQLQEQYAWDGWRMDDRHTIITIWTFCLIQRRRDDVGTKCTYPCLTPSIYVAAGRTGQIYLATVEACEMHDAQLTWLYLASQTQNKCFVPHHCWVKVGYRGLTGNW
jgi:hypothetical protein